MNVPTLSPPVTPVTERRVAHRFQPAFGTVCRISPPVKTDSAIVGLVWDISETGVSMLLGAPPKAGSQVAGELTPGTGGKGLPVTLRVVHVRPIQTGDYILGAQFERRLDPDEVRMFVVPPPPAGEAGAPKLDPPQGLPQNGPPAK